MQFRSRVLIHPGLNNSGPQHWQSLWEKKYPDFKRVQQKEWDSPLCSEWIKSIDQEAMKERPSEVIVVGHSLACCAIAYWAGQYNRKIKGALLVAPSDTEAETYPEGTTGFKPMPLDRLPFPSIVVASENDYYVTRERAKLFAYAWGSDLVYIGDAGHINSDSNLGLWEFGLELLTQLD